MNNLQSSKLLGLVVLFIMLLIHSCQVDVIEDLESVGEQAGEGCLMQISGTVINTKNLQPVANAELEANFFNATTDENGEFFIELYRSNVDESDIVKVRKEGYISNTFVVDYTEIAENNDCEEALSVGWSLSLSEEKAALQLDPETNGVFEFKDTIAFSEINEAGVTEILQDVNNYAVHITSGTVDKSTSISISPNHK